MYTVGGKVADRERSADPLGARASLSRPHNRAAVLLHKCTQGQPLLTQARELTNVWKTGKHDKTGSRARICSSATTLLCCEIHHVPRANLPSAC